MSKAPSKNTAVIQRLLEERRQYEAWIARIDAASGAAPAGVRGRVRSDYEARLNAVTEELKVHAEAARQLAAQRREFRVELQQKEKQAAERLSEAELRHAVGEYDESQWTQVHKDILSELVSGDRVSGPVRTPRRSERYPSLVRVETINGAAADEVADGARYEDQPVAYPSERLAFGAADPTLEAIEWLTPLGLGSRALIVGPARSGKTETLRSLLAAVAGRDDLHVTLVLAGVRPEELAQWHEGPVAPAGALTFAASADAQASAVEQALDGARRLAARGQDALVLIDGLDGLHPPAARRALSAARNLRDAGSLTLIATASRPFGGETTVIALDPALTATGRQPILDLAASGTLKPELLVGEDGARAIDRARAAALDASG